MGDQLDHLRQDLARRPAPSTPQPRSVRSFRQARVLAVASGKGGVGKTNLVVNLATTLIRQGQRVLIFDADLGMANVDVLLNISPPHNLSHAIHGTLPLDEIIYRTSTGLQILAGVNGTDGFADLPESQRLLLMQRLAYLEEQFDWLIIDCGAGVDSNVLGFACTADEVLVVCTPEPTAMMDAYGLLKLIHLRGGTPQFRLIMNMVERPQEGQTAAGSIMDVSEKFLQLNIQKVHYVPRDPALGQAVRRQTPIVEMFPGSPASRAIRAIAADLTSANQKPRPLGFFQRVGEWFSGPDPSSAVG